MYSRVRAEDRFDVLQSRSVRFGLFPAKFDNVFAGSLILGRVGHPNDNLRVSRFDEHGDLFTGNEKTSERSDPTTACETTANSSNAFAYHSMRHNSVPVCGNKNIACSMQVVKLGQRKADWIHGF